MYCSSTVSDSPMFCGCCWGFNFIV